MQRHADLDGNAFRPRLPREKLLIGVAGVTPSRASDHNDGPSTANDQGLDIAGLYAFMDPGVLDPALRNNVILILTFRGFITPGEAENMTARNPIRAKTLPPFVVG